MDGTDAWLTIRYDQVRSIQFGKGISLNDEQLTALAELNRICT